MGDEGTARRWTVAVRPSRDDVAPAGGKAKRPGATALGRGGERPSGGAAAATETWGRQSRSGGGCVDWRAVRASWVRW